MMNYLNIIIVQVSCGYHQDIVNGHTLFYLRLQGTQYVIICCILFNGFWNSLLSDPRRTFTLLFVIFLIGILIILITSGNNNNSY